MKKRFTTTFKTSLLVLFCLSFLNGYSQKIATLEVNMSEATFGLDIPVKINLDDITYLPDSLLILHEVKGSARNPVPFQIEEGYPRILHWIVKTGSPGTGSYSFELVKGEAPVQAPAVMAAVGNGALTIHSGDMNLIRYRYETLYPPEGIDSAFKRSGFIHPLWAPHGQELTRIQAPDHYHHYGIWNPWTRVEFEGQTIDFWNLFSRQGTVRFSNFVTVENGTVYSAFGALQEHVVFKKEGGEKVALYEVQNIRVYRPQEDQDFFIVDFDIQYNTASDSPFNILEYRYAGLGWRTTEKWDNKNSMVLTSEGLARAEADGSKASWCIVQGEIDDDYAGVVMMSYPTNYNHPEPLRIWPVNQNGRGDMFANFCPTKDMDWSLQPRKKYFLRYRFLVYNGKIEADKAESAWHYFAYPPEITVKTE
jgi:hypothetical protein